MLEVVFLYNFMDIEAASSGSIFKYETGSSLYTSILDVIKTIGETDANEGLTLFIKDPFGKVLATSSFINSLL